MQHIALLTAGEFFNVRLAYFTKWNVKVVGEHSYIPQDIAKFFFQILDVHHREVAVMVADYLFRFFGDFTRFPHETKYKMHKFVLSIAGRGRTERSLLIIV
ncbi:hypothetical protein EV644_11657 [Kribbella orskensis]|uniref:Uncharacterized protein n=1 Tax=Kribbella orskensis TaxID=2512216 RepID=A0ABY2BCU1_9ACTN|nr:hypothetical protein EV642_11757 [Kribbella sp. VKM Ac-2500]TCO16686.1 hypothetical protein EV644_11657 [Kribbella orskensis]